jgi:TetR/AcrR family transcriptional regulator, transcriptional repressor for nem operon
MAAAPRAGLTSLTRMSILHRMVRTREFDPANALATAVDLFAAKGYSETSMEDLVRATGVSRYGIYGTFGNKRELFEQALERYADKMGRQSFLRLLEPDASLVHIRRIFEERIEEMCMTERARGCLFVHTAMELAPHDLELQAVLQKFMKRMSKAFSVGLETAQERGEVRAELDVRQAGQFLTATMFGLAVMARSGFPRLVLDGIVEQALASLAA